MHGLHKVSQTPRTNATIRIGAKLRQFKALELWCNLAQKTRFRPELSTKL